MTLFIGRHPQTITTMRYFPRPPFGQSKPPAFALLCALHPLHCRHRHRKIRGFPRSRRWDVKLHSLKSRRSSEQGCSVDRNKQTWIQSNYQTNSLKESSVAVTEFRNEHWARSLIQTVAAATLSAMQSVFPRQSSPPF